MSINKIIGFILLAAGVLTIAATLFFSWQIFTGVTPAPELFSTPQERVADSSLPVGSLQDLQNQLPDLLGQQLQGLLPADTIPQMLNLAAWSMFAGLLLLGGSLIAGIGIKLVK
ncbi:MAG: hypothetical protein Q8P55_01220 [bacterium]|nr:hypothetical protein [bacterium]